MLVATSAPDGTLRRQPARRPTRVRAGLDERTLLVPERPGNRLADSLRNILGNPRVGLLFVVPGVGDTLRVNGRATLVTDEELLAPLGRGGQAAEARDPGRRGRGVHSLLEGVPTLPALGPARFVERSELPSPGEIHRRLDPSFDAEAYDAERAERYARREGFY